MDAVEPGIGDRFAVLDRDADLVGRAGGEPVRDDQLEHERAVRIGDEEGADRGGIGERGRAAGRPLDEAPRVGDGIAVGI